MRLAPEHRGKTEEELSRVCIEECGSQCCQGAGVIGLSPAEAEAFRGKAVLHVDDYAPYMLFAEQKEGKCPYLDAEGHCEQYEERPQACREYPNLPGLAACRLSSGSEGQARKPRIVLASVHGRNTPTDWQRIRDNLIADMVRHGIYYGSIHASSCRVDMNRNDDVEAFLKSEADALLFVDDDMDYPPDLAWRLWQANKPITCGLYFQRTKGQPYPHAYKYLGYLPDSHGQLGHLFQDLRAELHAALLHYQSASDMPLVNEKLGPYMDVDAGGTGCVLIRREVLEKVGYPWFRTQEGTHGDMMFFKKARDAGFSVTMDLGAICAHGGYRFVGLKSFLEACGEYEGPAVNSKAYWDAAHREQYGSLRHYPGLEPVLAQILAQFGRKVEFADFGCGRATLHRDLHSALDLHITGLDQAESAITDNGRRLPNDHWFVCDVTDAAQVNAALPGKADVTFSNSVIEHVREPRHLLANMWAHTAAGGLMVLGIPLDLPHKEHEWTFDYDAIIEMLRTYAWPLYVYPLESRAIVAVPKPEEA